MRKLWLAATVLAALVLGACTSALTGRGGTTTPPVDPPAGQIVFQARTSADGLTPIEYYLGQRPGVTIYGNGAAYVLRAEEGRGYPGRPLAFVKGVVPHDVLADLVHDARSGGLFDHVDYGHAQILDAGGVSVVFRPGAAAERQVDVYALNIEEADRGLTLRQRANRIALRAFTERLEHSVVLGDAQLPDVVPERVDVTETRTEATSHTPAVDWPGPKLDGLLQRPAARPPCGVLSGTDARAVYAAARDHGTLRWRAAGVERVLVIRALLPGESGCH